MTHKKMPAQGGNLDRPMGKERNNVSIYSNKPPVKSQIKIVSGFGQFHTANPTAANPKPYIPISIDEIYAMAADPFSTTKDDARWVIPSTTIDERSRVHEHQRMNGNYPLMWLDIDRVEGFTYPEVVEGVKRAFPGFKVLIYSTSGAKKDRPKSRVALQLEQSIPGSEYSMLAKILNDRIEAEGLPPDRANERPGQLCYLPNKGEFYQHTVVEGCLLNPAIDLAGEIKAEKARLAKVEAEREQRHQEALSKIQERITLGQVDPIQAYREEYPLELALEMYGYERCGDRWLSPLSESNNPGVSIDEDTGKWLSHHESDKNIGRPMKGGGTWGDSFDLFVFFEHGGTHEHGGDYNEALKAAGSMFTTVDPLNGEKVSITKLNQREFMRNQERQTAGEMFEAEKRPRFFFTNIDDIEIRPPDWLVKGFMERATQVQLFGDPEAGKSFIGIDIGCCVATGIPFHEAKVKQGPVLYIAGEGGPGLRRRVEAWKITNQVKTRIPFYLSNAPIGFCDPDSVGLVNEAIDALDVTPSLVVIDTLARNFGPGDENSNKDMTAFVAALDEIRVKQGCTIITIHHSGHGDKTRGRGAAALRAAIDADYKLERDSADVVRLTCTKMKDFAKPKPMAFTLSTVDLGMFDEDGEPVTSAVLVKTDYQPLERKCTVGRGKWQMVALEAFDALLEERGEVTSDASILTSLWRDRCFEAGLKKQDWYRCKKAFTENKLFTIEEYSRRIF